MISPLFFGQAAAQSLFGSDEPRLFGKVAEDKTLIGVEANRPLVGWEPLEYLDKVIENRLRVTVYAPLLENASGELLLRLYWWREVERPVGPNGTMVVVVEDERRDNVTVRASSRGPVTSVVAIPASPEESFLRVTYLDVAWIVRHKTLRSLIPLEQVYADVQLFALTVMVFTGLVAGVMVVVGRNIIKRVKYVPPLEPTTAVLVLIGLAMLFLGVLVAAFEYVATADWFWWEAPFALAFLLLVVHYIRPEAERWLLWQVRPQEGHNDRIGGRAWVPYVARDPEDPQEYYYIDPDSRLEVLYRLFGLRSRINFPDAPQFYVEDANGKFDRMYVLTSRETPKLEGSRVALREADLKRDGPPLAVAAATVFLVILTPWVLLATAGAVLWYVAGRLHVKRTWAEIPVAGMHGEDIAKVQAELKKLEDVAREKDRLLKDNVELQAKVAAGEAKMFQEGMKVLMRQVFTVVEPEAEEQEEPKEEGGRGQSSGRRQDRRSKGPEGAG